MTLEENFKKLRKKVSRGLVYQLTRSGMFFASKLSLKTGQILGQFLGKTAYYLLASERKKTLTHLEIAFGSEKSERERKQIAKNCFENLGQCFFDTLIIPNLPPDSKEGKIEFEGIEFLHKSMEKGKGTILVMAHISCWELVSYGLAKSGCSLVGGVAKHINNEGVNRLLVDFRKKLGTKTFLRDEPGIARNIIRLLRNNGVLGILIDQDTRVDGVFVDFFGRLANTPKGPVVLASATGATLLPCFMVREGESKYRMKIKKPVELDPTESRENASLRITAQLTYIIEQCIRCHPEQWVWMHRRWRRQKGEKIA